MLARMSLGLCGLLACALSGASALPGSERLIGGSTAPSGMFPFIVHLFKNGNPYCGGTLIDYQWVVTAAHCVADKDDSKSGAGSFTTASASDYKVGYGTNSGSLENSVDVESIIVNTAFDPVWYTSDIALIKLSVNDDIIKKAKTISISTAGVSAGQTMITAGWGQSSNDNSAQSNQLMYAGLVTADDETCKKGAGDWNGQNGRYVCTSFSTAPGIGTCFGDSGGPLLLNSGSGYTLMGLVSFDVNTKDSSNTRCAQDGNVSYFTRVSSYLSFISGETGISDSTLVGNSSPVHHSSDNSTSTSDNSSNNSDKSSKSESSDSNDKKDSDNKDSKNSSGSDSSKSSGSSSNGKTTDKSVSGGSAATAASDDDNGDDDSEQSGSASGSNKSSAPKSSGAKSSGAKSSGAKATDSAAADNQGNGAASIATVGSASLVLAILAVLV
ncbi:hypothetical protein EC988_002243 [Linderina pennispora]|nr:hypothetical protein EC988_002243 [Linderina pennispora]